MDELVLDAAGSVLAYSANTTNRNDRRIKAYSLRSEGVLRVCLKVATRTNETAPGLFMALS